KRLSGWKEDYESPKKKSIENELNKWKIQIRLEQDKKSLAVWYLNEEDVQLFFETVPQENKSCHWFISFSKNMNAFFSFNLLEFFLKN
ncbi:hypothetical protein RFI_32614, partial [Reticulomyxa filosa]